MKELIQCDDYNHFLSEFDYFSDLEEVSIIKSKHISYFITDDKVFIYLEE